MKPYGKTFRCSKDHKASECGICSEHIKHDDKSAMRRRAKEEILKEIENG